MASLLAKVLLSPFFLVELILWVLLQPFCFVLWFAKGVSNAIINATLFVINYRCYLEKQANDIINRYQSDVCNVEEESQADVEYEFGGKFATFVARKAYLQFGPRSNTQANKLVARKWIRNYLQEHYTSLRIVDLIRVMDEATFLSFIPTEEYTECERLASTRVYRELMPVGISSS